MANFLRWAPQWNNLWAVGVSALWRGLSRCQGWKGFDLWADESAGRGTLNPLFDLSDGIMLFCDKSEN